MNSTWSKIDFSYFLDMKFENSFSHTFETLLLEIIEAPLLFSHYILPRFDFRIEPLGPAMALTLPHLSAYLERFENKKKSTVFKLNSHNEFHYLQAREDTTLLSELGVEMGLNNQ